MTQTVDDIRTLGERRLAALSDPEREAPERAHAYPFEWGTCWKHNVEYVVDDFAAEVGFFCDVLGFPTNALAPDYAMLRSPDGACFFSFVPARPDLPATPPTALRMQFMLAGVHEIAAELERRGIEFEKPVQAYECNGQVYEQLHKGTFRTPHGIPVDLWGQV